MKTCAACGVENPDIARFCLACGTPLADAPAAQEMRKVVTIVFSDLKGSTSLGEALDSEALREVMTRYFDAMRGELERHGGVIEKFIGDAVMAVFGLPRLHEDDALRAVRAAAGMQAALEQLNVELETFYGVQLTNRTGVNTGEVVAGDPTSGQRLVTGDAVNVAARLEQAAGEREVLIGELTYRLVRDGVDVEEVEPLALKGKSEPVPAYRLVRVREAAVADAPHGARFVGRSAEVAELEAVLEDAVQSGRARLVTIVGDAGVGKSRLTSELLERTADRALALTGRCLPYGEGITFWPVAEALRTVAGIHDEDNATEAGAKLALLADPAGEGVADRLSSAMGLNVEPFPVEEVFWAVRRLAELLAKDRPVVFVIEDIHWAEPTMLGLIEHLFETVDAPVVIACPTRPELLEHNPAWGEEPGATRIVLDPLDTAESTAMIQGLLGGGELEESVVVRVVEAAEGNPLFAEQLLRMLTDEGLLELQDGTWRATSDLSEIQVPPTIQALLASRLDTLSTEQRLVIEPASVVGYEFAEGAVTALAPPDISPRVRTELTTLGHKHLVQPVEDGDEGMHRFHHIMIRDTAYDGILKRARADLHARFVAWADLVNKDRATEFEEILGYHLEQAWTYLSELGPLDERGREIGQEGSRRLAAAGRRAFARGDAPGAVALLGRAVALLPADDPNRIRLLPDYGDALVMTGRHSEALAVLEEAVSHAARLPAAAARASLRRLLVLLRSGDQDEWRREWVDEQINEAMATLQREGDEAGVAMAYRLLGWSAGAACRFEETAAAYAKAIEHARRAGDVSEERRAIMAYAYAISLGPTNVDEAIEQCEAGLEATSGNRRHQGILRAMLGGLYAMQGSFDHARELVAQARADLEELGLDMDLARAGLDAWRIERLANEVDAAELELRRSYATLAAHGERYVLSTVAACLGQTILDRNGALDEAEEMVNRSRELASEGDIATQALWRSARGRILSRREQHAEAEAMIREALAVLEPTDFTVLQLDVKLDLGDVLVAAGRVADARAAYETARELATTKGGVVLLGTVLQRLEEL